MKREDQPASDEKPLQRWIAATDGSSLGNPGPAGWAWAIAKTPALFISDWNSAGCGVASSHHAELMALVRLLEFVPPGQPVEVRMDSKSVINIAEEARHYWKRNGWRKRNDDSIASAKLVRRLDGLLEERDVVFRWVKAHLTRQHGDPLNFFVDKAAREAAYTQTPRAVASLKPEPTFDQNLLWKEPIRRA